MGVIYHLTSQEAWEEARARGEYEAPSLAEEGFIHCSKDVPQLLRVAARLYPGRAGLQVLDVAMDKLKAEVKFEASRSGETYPHIYGKLDLDAVERARPLHLDADGRHWLGE